MSILKNLAENLGFININQPKKKYVTLSENKSTEEKERAKYKVKNIDNLKEEEITKCPKCGVLSHKAEIQHNMKMCPNCNNYFNMSARERIDLLIDKGTFKEEDATMTSANPIGFPEYVEKFEKAQHDSGMKEGVVSGLGEINGIKVSIACMDFNFMGGSMGSVVGEKITSALERA